MSSYRGKWYGNNVYLGLHTDTHVTEKDNEIGLRADSDELASMLKLTDPDLVQTDCKGHPGYTSWYSKVPEASVGPGVKKDALKAWRAAATKLGIPLHCHYSGIWDAAACSKHPEWCAVGPDGKPWGSPDPRITGHNIDDVTSELICPRSPYLEKLMLPQMMELIDDWDADGFWVDGDIWAIRPCYCERCRAAFTEDTGIKEPPTETSDPNWPIWISFTRESFEEYVTRYCEAIHSYKPDIAVCSNWLQTFMHPGEPKVPTDWISGDNVPPFSLDRGRCEARFIPSRGKHWDVMIWAFYSSHGFMNPASPPTYKSVQMIQQEASIYQAFGGAVQLCISPLYQKPRNGQLIPWIMKRQGEVGRFIKEKRELCQDTETIPQVAVLHSEYHYRNSMRGHDIMYGDTAPVEGAVYSILENHYGVDILDEWALKQQIGEFSVIVAPEQHNMSDEMVDMLKEYVISGGRLLVSGAQAFNRFGSAFLGVNEGQIIENTAFYIPAQDGAVPVYSKTFRLITLENAKALGQLGNTPFSEEYLLQNPAAVINEIGKGAVAYIPFDIFRFFHAERYAMVRSFIGDIMKQLSGEQDIKICAPTCIDVALRKKDNKMLIHLINRSSGIPNQPNNGAIDEIPPVGPSAIEVKLAERPARVYLAFEDSPLNWAYIQNEGKVIIDVEKIHIHGAVVIELR